MAEQTPEKNKRPDDPERRAAPVGGATAVGEEADIAFGGMVGIAVVTAVLVSMLALGGFFPGSDDDTKADTAAEVVEVVEEEPVEEEAVEEEAPATTEAPVVVEPADATVTVTADGITLTGTVPDQATADALAAEALLSFPEASITNELMVVDGADPYTLTVTGEAADGATFDQVTAGFDTLGGDAASYTNDVTQAEPTGANAVVTATQGGITLMGTVPDEATAQALADAALAAYPADRITNELEVLDGAEPYTLTVTGETTDPILFGQVTAAYAPLGEAASTFTNDLTQAESSDVEAELNALDQILFQSGTAVILPESQAVVEAAAALMQANPDVTFEVGGHTDTRGSDVSNQALSEARATAVADALVGLGVTNELTAIGYGETRPIEANDDTAELQQANRRIEFRVL